MLQGGISSVSRTRAESLAVEPMAFVNAEGKWSPIVCDDGHTRECAAFDRGYLRYPHSYKLIGIAASEIEINARPTKLSECYGFSGTGTYKGGMLTGSALAADDVNQFGVSPMVRLIERGEVGQLRKDMRAIAPKRMDSFDYVRLYSVSLEGSDFVIAQRAFADLPSDGINRELRHVFLIAKKTDGKLRLLHWNHDVDEDERVFGTLRVASGKEFLVTVVSDPESQTFRVYGVRAGELVSVFSGGGSSC